MIIINKFHSKIYFLLFTIFFALNTYSQNNYSIKAKIYNDKDQLSSGNALLLAEKDSSLIKGIIFTNGILHIEDASCKTCLLKISQTGYEDTLLAISNPELKDFDFGKIIVRGGYEEIEVIKIAAPVPLFEKSSEDGLLVNVKKTLLASSVSASEILSKLPNIVINEGIISVVGRGEAFLYKNGKRITVEQLSAIPVQSIDKIEILANPSAKYDAEGKAVINIKTVVNESEGYDVGIVQNFTFAKHFMYSPALSFNYRKNKLSVNGNYSVTIGKDWSTGKHNRTIELNSGVFNSVSDRVANMGYNYVGNQSLGMGYQLNSKHTLSLEYSGLINVFDQNDKGTNTVISPSADQTVLNTLNKGKTVNRNNAVSFNYDGQLDDLGSSIFVGAQYSLFKNKLNDLVDETINTNGVFNEAQRKNSGANDINLFTIQADYNKSFKNEMKLQIGAKYGEAKNSSVIDLYSRPLDGDFSLVPGFSNNFEYKEKIPALYAQFYGKLGKKVSYTVGLRGEFSNITGFSNALNKKVIDSTYINMFPNATITYSPSDKWTYSLNYSERIGRPKYQDLDPFLWYQDAFTSMQGNPFIIPELSKNSEISLSYKTYSLKAGYINSKNPTKWFIIPGSSENGSIILQLTNFQRKHSMYMSLDIPFEKRFWKSFTTLSMTMDKYEDDRPEIVFRKPYPQLYIYSYHRFKVKNWFNTEIIFEYEGTKDDGLYRDNQRYSLSFGLSKTMMDGNFTVRLLANDLFRLYKETGNSRVGNVAVNYDRRQNVAFYRLSLTYNFGKLRDINYKNKATGNEELDRIKK